MKISLGWCAVLLGVALLVPACHRFEIDAKGRFVVYCVDHDTVDVLEIYKADLKTGEVVKLNADLGPTGSAMDFRVDPKGRFALYFGGPDSSVGAEVFKADFKTGEVVTLNSPLVTGGEVVDAQIVPKGRYVVYLADQDTDGVFELFKADLKTGEVLKVNAPLVSGGGLLANQTFGAGLQFDPKGRFVIYLADQDVDDRVEVYKADLLTGEVVTLNAPLVAGGNVTQYQLDPKGRFLVYLADQEEDQVFELFATNLKTGQVVKLNGALVPGGDVTVPDTVLQGGMRFDPKGKFVLFRADQDEDERQELFKADLATGVAVKVSGALISGGDVSDYRIDRAGRFVVYRADQQQDEVHELFVSHLKAGVIDVLNPALVPGGDVYEDGISIDPKGRYVAYVADQDTDEVLELYAAELKTGSVFKLNAPLVTEGDILVQQGLFGIGFDPKGRFVVYSANQDAVDAIEIYKADLKTHAVVKLNGPLVPGGGSVYSFLIDPKGARVVYAADQDTLHRIEFYKVDLKTLDVLKVNTPVVAGGGYESYF